MNHRFISTTSVLLASICCSSLVATTVFASDLWWRNQQSGENWLYQMQSGKVNSMNQLATVAPEWQGFRGDFNGDGEADMLWRNQQSGQNWLYQMSGTSIVSSQPVNVVDVAWQLAGTADFNGDGLTDVLWRHTSTGLIWQYQMQGHRIISHNRVAQISDADWHIAGLGDFDGDGIDDILWRHQRTGLNYLYLMANGHIKQQSKLNVVDSNWQVAAILDADGDGTSDILWRNSESGQNWLYQMVGGVIQQSRPLNRVSDGQWQVVASGDYNGDGKDDLYWHHQGSGQTAVYLLDGHQISQINLLNTVPPATWNLLTNQPTITSAAPQWLDIGGGLRIRAQHPRIFISPEHLQRVIERMIGPNARAPYSDWLALYQEAFDAGKAIDLPALALLYKATGNSIYLEQLIDRIPTTGTPGLEELYAIDLVFDDLSDSVKYAIMRRAAENPNGFYYNALTESQGSDANWGYHLMQGPARALAYSGIFALTDVELNKDPLLYPFDTQNYIHVVNEELSASGRLWQIENRVAGDPTFNNALWGSPGGMYDNFGYDQSEEAYSINLLYAFETLTGINVTDGAHRDKYRATFYQNMHYPHRYQHVDNDSWCRRANTEYHTLARIWNTQTDYINQPATNQALMTAHIYQDPRMQYYVEDGVQPELCGSPYNNLYYKLVFYNDTLPKEPPSTNPTAMYFNGPGLVSMRSDWSNDAAFGVFMAGEGISRRYEDGNSFLISRKADVATHGGARIRRDYDNDKHHWYHIRSIAKNTLKIFDPNESFDINPDGTTGPLHSGTPLVASDNMGGQIFETSPSTEDRCYYAPDSINYGCRSNLSRKGDAFPLGVYETANIIKYEHIPDQYTYTVGDATAAYTQKIDYFEREFLFLRPDIFVIFDRVNSVDPSFKKVWTMHTIDQPVADAPISASDMGMTTHTNANLTTIHNPLNITYIDTLLPQQNNLVVRGGDTVLTTGKDLASSQVDRIDIPRWLEIFVAGSDIEGSLTLHGDAEEGDGITEDILFDGKEQQALSSRPTQNVAGGILEDTTQNWQPDQWKDYYVNIATNPRQRVRITGNSSNQLFGDFTDGNAWQYIIYRPLANSYNHWKRISSVTSNDMDVDNLTLSVPHYFDAVDASGRLHSFAPHTDSKNDGYKKRTDLGQWTLTIEASSQQQHHNFFNIISLKDPDAAKPSVQLVEGTGVSGALIDNTLAVFANEPQAIDETSISLPSPTIQQCFIFNLQPETDYYYQLSDSQLVLSSQDNGGVRVTSSAMGVVRLVAQ